MNWIENVQKYPGFPLFFEQYDWVLNCILCAILKGHKNLWI